MYIIYDYIIVLLLACDDSQCLLCAEAADKCTVCQAGSYVTDNNDCASCATSCLACIDITSCSQCAPGTYWDNLAGACLRT